MSKQSDQRLRLIMFVFAAAFAVVIGRALYVQILQASALAARAHGQQNSTIVLPTNRGRILDATGQALAVDVPAKDLMVYPSRVQDSGQVASYIAQKLGYPLKHKKAFRAEVKLLVGRLTVPHVVQARVLSQLDPAVAADIMSAHPPGLFTVDSVRRDYPSGKMASQLIGYVDSNNSGKWGAGVEHKYNSVLGGHPGEQLEVRGPGGVPLSTVTLRRAQQGRDVQLTIDRSIQQKVQSVLDATVSRTGAHTATALVLDPRNGSILAMATAPGYDNNTVHDLSTKQRERDSPNMAVEYSYEPGSTFKVVTMGAALTAGIVTPQTQFRIPYAIKVGDRIVHDDAPRPTRTFTAAQILQQSSNVGTVTIAELVHKQPLYDWIRRWGFGSPTHIGLPAEAAPAILPPDKWYSSSIGNIPIGQGIAVTPLQMAAMYAGIANGGVLVEPHVVEKIGGRPAPKPVSRRVLSPTVDHTLVNMLKGVVDTAAGTGTRASVPGYTVAGKTGTAQVALPHSLGYSTRNYVASFVGFLPADNPRVEVLVVVNSPRTNIFGGIVAAPAFQQIATFLTKDLAIPPDKPLDLPVN
ncbi:MAG: peptidoglycan D,D-transpeptidase FtsI family protein [Gaiellales bacterium]